MNGLIRVMAVTFLLLFAAPSSAHDVANLNTQELKWIHDHPYVTYTVKEMWPQEYIQGKEHIGLSRDFLDDIEKQTGLHFIYVPGGISAKNKVMMNPSISESLLTSEDKEGWLFTSSWMSSIPMLVARNSTTHIRTLEQLTGRTVSVVKGGEYINWLQKHHPDIHLLPGDTASEVMQDVQDGKAEAAIGSGLIMLPVFQRKFSNSLAIASQVPEMASGINMAVAKQYPELLSILNKSLESMSAKDVQDDYIKWFGIVEYGAPSIGVLFYHYWRQIVVFSILILILLWALRRAYIAKKQAQQSEAEKSAFLAMMSHEIRTPMNALIAALELLRLFFSDIGTS